MALIESMGGQGMAGTAGASAAAEDTAALRARVRELEWRLDEVQRLTHLGVWEERDGETTCWSEEMFRIFGWPPRPGPVRLADVFAVVHSDDARRVTEAVEATRATGQLLDLEHRIVRPDGEVRVIRTHGGIRGQGTRMFGTSFDVTEQRAAEASLRAGKERYQRLVETMNEGVLVLDSQGVITFGNRKIADLFGTTIGEARGRRVDAFVPDPGQAEFLRAKLASRGTVESEEYEWRLRGSDGRERWLRVSASALPDPAGAGTGVLAVVSDVTERHELADTLRQSQELLQAVIDEMPAAIFVKDLEGRLLMVNRAWEQAAGVLRAAAIGRRASDVFPPEVGERFETADARALTSETLHQVMETVPTPAGVRQFLTSRSPHRGADGRVRGLVGVAVDVTDVKRTEAALHEKEQLVAALLEGAAAVIFIKDVAGRYLVVNRQFEKVLGFRREEVIGRTAHELFGAEFGDRLRATDLAVIQDGEARELDEAIPQADGVHTFRALKFPLKDAAGVPYALCGISSDLTEQRRNEADRLRLAEAVEQAAEAIVITDRAGRILYVNPGFERLSGYARAEAIGQTPRLLKSGKQGPEFYAAMWATLARGEVWKGRFVNRRKDGKLYEAEATISPVRAGDGQVVNYVAVQRDLTNERRLEGELLQAQKMEAVGRLAGGVAHDFNNLLGVILGYTEMLLGRSDTSAAQRAKLDQVRMASERAAALTRQLLAFSRKQVLDPKVLDLGTVVAEMAKMIRRLIGEDVELVVEADEGLGRVQADPGQVEQVIMNLAVNARDAMSDGGRLVFTTANVDVTDADGAAEREVPPGRYVALSVADTGCGMDAEVLKHIFEPFFTTKPAGKGTGLGLATVYGIVAQSGGHIRVRTAPGAGTTFLVYFPRVDKPVARGTPEEGAATPAGVETILLVEDDEALRGLAREFLEGCGYTVVAAADAAQALPLAEEGRPIDALLTDVVLPGMGGPALADRLRRRHPRLRVVFTSGHPEESLSGGGVLAAGSWFLPKPFTMQALARKLREALDA